MNFKIKLLISVFLLLFTAATVYEKHSKEAPAPQVSAPNENNNFSLTTAQLKERFDYMLTGQVYKNECENDFNKIGTGEVITDNSVYGKGAKVIYCKSGRDKEGYVMEGLIKPERVYNNKDKWQNDTMHNWYIRPRLRIKQSLVYPLIQGYNSENWHTKICRLEVVNTEGKVIKEVEYEGKDFWEKHPEDECKIYYSGNYSNGRYYLDFDSVIAVSGKALNPSGKANIKNSRLDYRIYWYGITDLWVDCITVYNDTYKELMSGKYDIWLKEIADNPDSEIYKSGNMIYSSKDCLDYADKKIKEFTLEKYSIKNNGITEIQR